MGKLQFAKLAEAKVPLIVGLTIEEYDHFVVYRGTDNRWVYLADPIRGNIRVSIPVFLDQWQQNAVLAVHKPGEKIRKHSKGTWIFVPVWNVRKSTLRSNG